MPRGKYRQKQWDARQNAILEALAALVAHRPFDAITMDEIADEVGISKATLYQHFESKDALLENLLTVQTARFMEWLDSTAAQTPVERLCAVMEYISTGDMLLMRSVMRLGSGAMGAVMESRPEMQANHAHMLAAMDAIVTAGQADGSIVPDVPPRVVISAVWSLSTISLLPDSPPDSNAHTLMLLKRAIMLNP